MRLTPFLMPLAAYVFAAVIPSSAHADDRAAARPLFDEGKRLMKEGKTAEACTKFEAASHFTTTAGVRLNLAGCWAKLGRTASAWGMYDEARALAERGGDTAAAELAQKGKAELEPKLSRLIVNVAPANAAGLTVARDGEAVFSGAWGVGVPVDPGDHEITAHAPGRKDWSSKVTVAGEAASVSVTVPVLEPVKTEAVATQGPSGPEPATTALQPSTESPASSSNRGSTQRVIGLVTGGVGIVALGVGAGFVGKTISDKNSYEGNELPNGQCKNLACQTQSQSATSSGNIATAFVVGGAVLVAGGLVVWLTAPRSHEGTRATHEEQGTRFQARLAPTAGFRGAGLALEGSW
jgi:hypothetical protein